MPFPATLAKINKSVTNPVTRRFAGRIPPMAIVVHVGRGSGKEYRTPVMAFPTGDGFVIPLTYGRGTDWEKNVLATSGCRLIYRSKDISLTGPEIVRTDQVSEALPDAVRLALHGIGAPDAMRLHRP